MSDIAIPEIPGRRALGAAFGVARSPGFKFVLMGLISTLLLVPAMMVLFLVEERSDRALEVAGTIAAGWGGEQALNGPYLVIPYRYREVDQNGRERPSERRYAIQSAETAQVTADVSVEERRKSIYSLPVYHAKAKLSGRFGPARLDAIREAGGEPEPGGMFMVMSLSDLGGFRSEVMLSLDGGQAAGFLPGLRGVGAGVGDLNAWENGAPATSSNFGGIHAPVEAAKAASGFAYAIDLAYNGSKKLMLVPNAATTSVEVASSWPHPGFGGRYLPDTRDVTETGFTAAWTIPSLARGVDPVSLGGAMPRTAGTIEIGFVEPLQFYQKVSRTLKYSIVFFALVFLAVFVLELTGRRPVHWIQYILVGLALVVFFILLLALAEHVGFAAAYGVSAAATTALIAWYVGDALRNRNQGLTMAAVLGLLYLVVFLVLNEEEYALLAGAIIAFSAIAATMVLTRRIDWSGETPAAT